MTKPVSADVSAQLDRNQINLGETVRLIIQSDQINDNAQPDFSELRKNFGLLGTSTSKNVSIINGQQTSSKQWVTTFDPMDIGSFTIPAIKVGKETTQPLRLTVLPANSLSATGDVDIFLELITDKDSYYVQEQIILSIRLYYRVTLIDGSLPDPAPENTDVRRLGKDIQYKKLSGNREYQVIERRFALFAGASGDLIIPAIRFQGVIEDNTSGNQIFSSFFNQGKRISAKSESIQLKILPPNESFVGKNWLPAKDLNIIETTDLQTTSRSFQIGEPITRTIEISAVGLTAEQLPAIEFPDYAEFKLYPDKTNRQSGQEANNIQGKLVQSIAIIPSQSGQLTLPEISINWWNTETETLETSTLPELQLQVTQPSSQTQDVVSNQNTLSNIETVTTNNALVNIPDINAVNNPVWIWISGIFAILWLFTLLLLFKVKSGNKNNANDKYLIGMDENLPDSGDLLNSLKLACKNNDPDSVRKNLHAWLNSLISRSSNRSLESLAKKLEIQALKDEVSRLDRSLYKNENPAQWNGNSLLKVLDEVKIKASQKKPPKPKLPALYLN